MSKVTVTESYLEGIGDAIRGKLGTSQGYTPAQMAAAINSIPTGGITPTGTISITQNGTADVTQYASAAVNVPNSYTQADEGKVVQSGVLVAQTSETVTQNGTYDTTTKDEVVVDVQGAAPNLQDKTFTQNGTYTADAGYDGFDEVTVNVSGGGGSTNILSGTDAPTSAQGSDGDIYLRYTNASIKNASGQWINTGYHGSDSSKYVIDFKLTKAQSSEYPTTFGARSATGSVANASYLHLAKGSRDYSGCIAGWGNMQNQVLGFGASEIVGKMCEIELQKGSVKFVVDGVETTATFTAGAVTDTSPIAIFGVAVNSSLQPFSPVDGMELFGFKIYENDILVHDYIPTLDGNGTACLYDSVTSEYKYHSGGGTLAYTAGGKIETAFVKVSGAWQNLIGSNIEDITA